MAIPLASAIAVCSRCGEPLNAKGDCLACLLRTGLDESVVETKPLALLVFGDFEVEQRADGFYWELGHGAMGVTYSRWTRCCVAGFAESDRRARGGARLTIDARTLFA